MNSEITIRFAINSHYFTVFQWVKGCGFEILSYSCGLTRYKQGIYDRALIEVAYDDSHPKWEIWSLLWFVTPSQIKAQKKEI